MGGRVLIKWRASLLSENAQALITTRSWLFGYEVGPASNRAEQDIDPKNNMVTVIDHCAITPLLSGTISEKSLPLTFFDIPWIHTDSSRYLIFYATNHSKNHFIETIVPSLKHSLSLTLKHYYPLAGNLVFPPDSDDNRPEIRFVDGDSVSLTFAESISDFHRFLGNHPRNTVEFYPFLPKLPPVSADKRVVPLAAIQVTHFPNSGICVGFNIRHVAGDGNAIISFIKSWASITKLGGDAAILDAGLQPNYERAQLRDTKGVEIETIVWNHVKGTMHEGSSQPHPHQLPNNKVRAKFVINQSSVQQLKKQVLTAECQQPLSHVSTFTVTSSYLWSCLAKARAASAEELADGDEMEHLIFMADCRSRLNPPLPETYFGDCIAPMIASVKGSQLRAEDGFVIAAKSIGSAIRKRLKDEGEVLEVMENWIPEIQALKGEILGIASSPKFKVYDIDFGWGRPTQSEYLSIDSSGALELGDAKNGEGDIEISLSYPKPILEAFESHFNNGLEYAKKFGG